MEFTQLLIDLGKMLPGLVLLIAALVNIGKHFGWVKDGETFANTAQLVVSVLLTLVGAFVPNLFDWFPYIDEISRLLAELGGYVLLVIPVIVKLGNIFHDLILTKFTLFGANKVIGKRLTG